MSTQTYMDTPRVLIQWDGAARWILIRFRDWAATDEIEAAIPTFLEAVEEHHATRCLSDSRQRHVVQPGATTAFADVGIPRAAALGLKRLAIVLPRSVVTLSSMEPLLARYREHVETETFGTLEDAGAWLATDRPGTADPRPAGQDPPPGSTIA
jgi:hypothetical protein